MLGPSVCTPGSTRSSTAISCITSRGYGTVAVTVVTPLQASVAEIAITYGAPEVFVVTTPNGRSIEGGFLVHVEGKVGGRRVAWAVRDAHTLTHAHLPTHGCTHTYTRVR